MSENTPLSRRTVIKALGGTGIAAATGGAALLATTGTAAAAQSFSIDGSSVSLDDGQVSYVAIDSAGSLSWDGFDVAVERLRFVSEVRLPGESTGWHTLADSVSDTLANWSSQGSGSDGWGGPDEYVVSNDGTAGEVHTGVQWAIISDGSHPSQFDSIQTPVDWTDLLSVGTDGDSKTTTVEMRSTVYFLDADQNQLSVPSGVQPSQATAAFDVTVTNEAASTGGSSTGTSTVA